MYGPPGNGSPSTRATLSNASPAASSTVAPSDCTSPVTSGTSNNDEWPPDTSKAMHGSRQRTMFEDVDRDMCGEMIHAVQRLAQSKCVRLRRRDTDEQRARQTWARRHRDRVDVTRVRHRPRCSARCIAGTIASRCARLATSGTTPPKRACSSTLLAIALASSVCAAHDADAGLVARRLDAEHQRLVSHRHSPAPTTTGRRP